MQGMYAHFQDALKDFFKARRNQEALFALAVALLFIAISLFQNRYILARNLTFTGYGYSSNGYGYGYGYSDNVPAVPAGFSCSGASTTSVTCTWTAVTTTMSGTEIIATDFSSYKLYQSSSDFSSTTLCPVSGSGVTTAATVTTQSTATATVSGLTANTRYNFALCAFDTNNNNSPRAAIASGSTNVSTTTSSGGSSGGGSTSPITPITTIAAPSSTATPAAPTSSSVAAEREAQVKQITSEAQTVSATAAEGLAALVGVKRSLATEQSALSLLGKAHLSVTTGTIAFVAYGTPSTVHLGAGERAGVLASFIAAYKTFPQSATQWSDLIKIGNGRWPTMTSSEAEAWAMSQFKKMYLRDANRKNANDDAAVVLMAYGLRQTKGQRNLNTEKAAIKIYKGIFKKAPATAHDWDSVRAIGYSGAKR